MCRKKPLQNNFLKIALYDEKIHGQKPNVSKSKQREGELIKMSFIIREMAQTDWPEVVRIYREGIDTNIATFQTDAPSFEEWDASHLHFCRLVIAENGRAIGWAALTPVSDRCVYAGVAEVSIYIGSDCRGRGAGEQLLKELIRLSEEHGIWTLQSGIMSENAASIRLHEKCGFRMVDFRKKIGRDHFEVWRDTVIMERRSTSDCFEASGTCSAECCCREET